MQQRLLRADMKPGRKARTKFSLQNPLQWPTSPSRALSSKVPMASPKIVPPSGDQVFNAQYSYCGKDIHI